MPRSSTTTDAARAMDALRRIVRSLHSANARAERAMGLTAAQLFVLRQVAAEPGLSMKRLAERTRSAQSSVSEVVARLVADGYMEKGKSAEDARRTKLMPTASGRRVAVSAGETIQERLVAALEALPARQRLELVDALEAWIVAADLGNEPADFFFTDARDSSAARSGAEPVPATNAEG